VKSSLFCLLVLLLPQAPQGTGSSPEVLHEPAQGPIRVSWRSQWPVGMLIQDNRLGQFLRFKYDHNNLLKKQPWMMQCR
jgi:hypothetical protein